MEKYKNLPVQAKAAIWFVICSVLQKGISVITTPIFTRLMTTEEYGRFNVFLSWETIFAAIMILSLPWGVYPQGLVKFEEERDTFSSSSFGLMTTLMLIWSVVYFIFRGPINRILHTTTPMMLCMFVIIWSSSTYNFWAMYQRVNYEYRKLVILTVSTSLLIPIVSIILIKSFDDHVMARVIGISACQLLIYGSLGLIIFRGGKQLYSKNVWQYDIRFNIPLLPHYLSQRVLTSSDRIMIEYLINSSAAGIYSLSYSLGFIAQTVTSAIADAIGPWQYRKIKERDYSGLAKMAYVLLSGVAGAILLFICFAPEIVAIFAPAEYSEASYLIPPIAISVYYVFMYGIFADFEFYFEKTRMISVATLCAAVVNIVLNYIFVRIYGYAAASYTTLACYIMYAVFHYNIMLGICRNELGNVKIYNTSIIVCLSAGFTVAGLLTMMAYPYFIVRLIVVLLILLVAVFKRDLIRKAIVEFRKRD